MPKSHIHVEDMTDEQYERYLAKLEQDEDSRLEAYVENAERLAAHE
jgi:hypothetical protein